MTHSLHPSHVCACTNQEQDFQRHLSSSFFVFNQLWLEMIVCVVDIGGIVDHHCSLHNCTVNKIHMFTVLPETRFT